jgi:hypothetical protein
MPQPSSGAQHAAAVFGGGKLRGLQVLSPQVIGPGFAGDPAEPAMPAMPEGFESFVLLSPPQLVAATGPSNKKLTATKRVKERARIIAVMKARRRPRGHRRIAHRAPPAPFASRRPGWRRSAARLTQAERAIRRRERGAWESKSLTSSQRSGLRMSAVMSDVGKCPAAAIQR